MQPDVVAGSPAPATTGYEPATARSASSVS